jgi:type I restriction enzyme S subunit
MYFVTAKIKITFILEQLHDGHFQCVFVKVRHSVHSLLRIPICQSAQPINDNLEATAQAIFQEQFASYYEADGLPDGYRIVTLDNLCTVKGGKRLPADCELLDTPTEHPYIRVRDVGSSRYVCLTGQFQYIDEETHLAISRYIVNTDDIIISIVGTIGLIGKVHSSLDKANLTENCVKLANIHTVTSDYLYYTLCYKKLINEIELLTVGAVQAKLPMYNIQSMKILVPPADVINEFQCKMNAVNEQIEANTVEIQRLYELQGVLLARLSD